MYHVLAGLIIFGLGIVLFSLSLHQAKLWPVIVSMVVLISGAEYTMLCWQFLNGGYHLS